ncbi:ABC transporter permease [Verrucomicrobium spinosum]|uniref:ABC transporter permease n=1 Tax=Verrucomicrobium spinosum TaxID=2736 RepID=UPI0009465E16|nr:hypothetical protein [Verrucomicrobium spinosum]
MVKELRQGLKTKAFIAIFILVQVVMTLLVGMQLLALANGASRGAMVGFDGFFWAFVWIPLLVLMPARGLLAVSDEVKANTLDLVQLTRMSAFRIVLGKWVALVAQSLLLVAAVLPYAVLRYFFGQVNVVDDLTVIAVMVAVSFVFTAFAVALSSAPMVFRIIALVVFLPFMFSVGISSLFANRLGFMGMSGSAPSVWLIVTVVGLYVYLLLEIAATRIAPVSENHSARKRLTALGMAVVANVLAYTADEDVSGLWFLLCTPIWGWIILEALCEHTVRLPSLYSSWARRGLMGRIAGRVLYPGWATALLFTGILYIAQFNAVYQISQQAGSGLTDLKQMELIVTFVLIYASAIAPLPVLLLFPRVRQPIWLYVLIQALFGLLFAIASIVAGTPGVTKEAAYRWLAPFPPSALFAFMEGGTDGTPLDFYFKVTLAVVVVLVGYLGFRMIKEFRAISGWKINHGLMARTASPQPHSHPHEHGITPDGSDGGGLSVPSTRVCAPADEGRGGCGPAPFAQWSLERGGGQRAGAGYGELHRLSGPASLHPWG